MIPASFWQAVQQFNQQQFYSCHDTLEAIWIEAPESDKNFYQGILQVAVACYHLGNENLRGAVILLGEGAKRLRDYQPEHYQVDVELLLEDSLDLLVALQQTPLHQMPQIVEQLKQCQQAKVERDDQTTVLIELPQIQLIKSKFSHQSET